MKVVGYRTTRDSGARPGEQIVHHAVLACGHLQRVGHGHATDRLRCLDGCDETTCRYCGHAKSDHVVNQRIGGGDVWLICPEQATDRLEAMARFEV